MFFSTSKNQGIPCFNKNNYTSLCYFYQMNFIQRWLANFRWLAKLTDLLEFHKSLSEMLLTACADQLLHNLSLIKLYLACAKQNKWWLFIVSKIDIIWYSRTTPKFINYQLWKRYKMFISLKYLCHIFLPVVDCTFFTRVLKSNAMEI